MLTATPVSSRPACRLARRRGRVLRAVGSRRLVFEPLEERRLLAYEADRFEPNDTLAAAADIGAGPGVHLPALTIHETGDADWYGFELLRSGGLRVELGFATGQGALEVEITDPGGSVLATGVPDANGASAVAGGLPAGSYRIHVWGAAGVTNKYSLAIEPAVPGSPRMFYVNDARVTNDYYTLAAGSDAHDGLTPSTPKATVQDVLADYDLGPADLVVIDTGTYGGSSVTIGAADEGAVYAGSPGGSLFSYGGTRWDLTDADHNLIYGLTFTGSGGTGIAVRPGAVDPSTDNLLWANRFTGTATGIQIDGGTANVVRANVFSASGRTYGVYALGSPSLTVEANDIAGATYGVYLTNGTLAARGNVIHDNTTGLISYSAGCAAWGNTVHHNTTGLEGYGVFGGTDWWAGQPNDVSDNGTGIRMYSGATVAFNRIHGNVVGVQADDGARVHHNVVYRNTGQGILVDNGRDVTVENNTIYTSAGDAVRIRNSASNVVLKNNILWTDSGYDLYVATDSQQGFASDYNNLFTAGGATLVWWQKPFTDLFDWQVEADYDSHSLGYTTPHPTLDNPQFVDLTNDDYHLSDAVSTSIDAGDPSSQLPLEPSPNGGRIDLGAYGNTAAAARSPDRCLVLDYPNYYLDWPSGEDKSVRWHTYDAAAPGGQLAGTVNIDLYQAGVGHVAQIGSAPAAQGEFGWRPDSSGITPSITDRYWIEITWSGDAAIRDESREPFSVPPSSHEFFVNDSVLANDQYSTAVGNNRSTGKTPADPKANLLPLLRAYQLGPDDEVRIDTGEYIHVRNVVISGESGLGLDEGLLFTGPTEPGKAAHIDRANPYAGATNIELRNGDWVTLQYLTLTGAAMGLWVHDSSTYFRGRYLTVWDNTLDGIRMENDTAQSELDHIQAFRNGGAGIYLATAITRLTASEVYGNGTGIYATNLAAGVPTAIGSADAAGSPNLAWGWGTRSTTTPVPASSPNTTCWCSATPCTARTARRTWAFAWPTARWPAPTWSATTTAGSRRSRATSSKTGCTTMPRPASSSGAAAPRKTTSAIPTAWAWRCSIPNTPARSATT